MNIKKIKTKKEFYRPKNIVNKDGEISTHNFNRFISNFIDKYTWGNNKRRFLHLNNPYFTNENKDEIHQGTKDWFNKSLYRRTSLGKNGSVISFDASDKFKLKLKDIHTHLTTQNKREYVFYVNSQWSHFPLICFDVDTTDTTTDEDIQEVKEYLLSLHPNAYYEYSTNKKGLHFYILLDLSQVKIDSIQINKKLSEYAYFLKLYINSRYNVLFDDIKSNFSSYEWDESLGCYQLINAGNFCKLPRPVTIENYKRLYNLEFTTTQDIDKNYDTLFSLINSIYAYITFGSTGFSFLSSWLRNPIYIQEQKETKPYKEYIQPHLKHFNNFNTITHTLTSTLLYPTDNVLVGKLPLKGQKQGFEINEIIGIEDSFAREEAYIFRYLVEHYKNNQEIPTLEQTYQDYLIDTNYTKTDTTRQERFQGIYEYILTNRFKPEKIVRRKKGIYLKDDYIVDIKKLYPTETSIKLLQQSINQRYKGRIKYEDISLAAGFYFVSLTRYLEKKDFRGNEFTVAQNNMVEWFRDIKETVRTCDKSKAKILKDILIKMGWLKCIDVNFIIGKHSRRYLLTKSFPRYKEFEDLVGREKIEAWSKTNITMGKAM